MATVDSFESRVAEIVETTLAENAVPFWHRGCDGSCEAVALWRSHIATIIAAEVVEEATKTVTRIPSLGVPWSGHDGWTMAFTRVLDALGGKGRLMATVDKPKRYKVDSYTREGHPCDAVRDAIFAFEKNHPGCRLVSHAHQFAAHDGLDVVVTVVYEERE